MIRGERRCALAALLVLFAACAIPLEGATRVHLITTGGTIANASSGRLTPDALLRMLPHGAPPGIELNTAGMVMNSSDAPASGLKP